MLNRTQKTAAQQLADFAVALTFDDLPPAVVTWFQNVAKLLG